MRKPSAMEVNAYHYLGAHIERSIALTEADRALIATLFTEQKLSKNQFLVRQGELCLYESFVVGGCLKSYHTDEKGEAHVLRFSVEGWWASDLKSLQTRTPATFSIEALEPTTVLTIDKTGLDTLYEQAPALNQFFRVLNEQAADALTERLMATFRLTAKERYAAFLKTYPQIAQRVPLKDIASYLGITPVFLSQLRRQAMQG